MPMPPPSVLMVYPGCLLTYSGGTARALAMAQALKEAGFRLALVSRDQDRSAVLGLGIFDLVHLFGSKPTLRLKADADLRSYIIRNIDIEFNDFAVEIIRHASPCSVICHYAWTAGVFWNLPAHILRVLDTIDIQFRRAVVAKANGVAHFDRQSGRREELRELRKAQVIVAIQSEEREIFQKLLPDRRVICATHSHVLKPLASPADSRELLFIGSNYDPNIQGIVRFITVAWPRIREAVPGAVLNVCGKVCESLFDFQNHPGVRLHGEVPDKEPFYKRAAIVVNAALYGTGLPIKTSEALGYGKCLVCNESGARGFDRAVFPGQICDYEAMPVRIINLLENPDERRKMEDATAAYAARYMAPSVIFKDLIAVLLETCRHPAPVHVEIPRSGVFAKYCNYPFRKLICHYSAKLFARVFQFQAGGGNTGGRILEMYIRLRWRELARDQHLERVAVYGAGKHTRWLEWVLRNENVPEVAAVLDDHAAGQAAIFGQSVLAAADFDPSTVDAVILSSDCIQEKLARRCRELYGRQTKLVDLYEGLPQGPYKK